MTQPSARPFPHPEDLLPGADFGDCFGLTATGLDLDAVTGSQQAFGRAPRWIGGLMRLRNLMVAPLGLKAGRERAEVNPAQIGIFPVISQSPEKVIMGLDDRHLDFRVLVEVRTLAAGRQDISVSTAVRTHNRLGRTYLALVKPFHRLIVPMMLKQAVSGSPATIPLTASAGARG